MLRYDGDVPRCRDCQCFYNIGVNARRVRRDGSWPGLEFDRATYLAWARDQARECAFCGIPEREIPRLGLVTQIGLPSKFLGLDRIRGDAPYRATNVQLSCFACNKVKSNTFADREMKAELGAGVARIWDFRLGRTIGRHSDTDLTSDPWPLAAAVGTLPSSRAQYAVIRANARRPRARKESPELRLSFDEFSEWDGAARWSCDYCGLPQELVRHLGVVTQVGRPLRNLGIDRLDAALPYSLTNLCRACFPCNKAKSDVFTADEMRSHLGPAIGRVWRGRLIHLS